MGPRTFAGIALTLILAGCSDSPTGNQISVELVAFDPQVTVYESVSGRIRGIGAFSGVSVFNETPRPIGFDPCTHVLQHKGLNGWSGVLTTLCAGGLTFWVEPGEGQSRDWSGTTLIDRDWIPPQTGEYRFLTRIRTVDRGSRVVYSEPFVAERVVR